MILSILYWFLVVCLYGNCTLYLVAIVSEKFRNKLNIANPMLSFMFQASILYFLTH